MKRKIATLDVYIDPESNEPSSTGKVDGAPDGPGRYQLTVNKGTKVGEIKTMGEFRSTFAHELGHFVSLVTRDETHDPTLRLFSNLTGNGSLVLPAETKAWEVAQEIYPALDEKHAKTLLDTYRSYHVEPDPLEDWENEGGQWQAYCDREHSPDDDYGNAEDWKEYFAHIRTVPQASDLRLSTEDAIRLNGLGATWQAYHERKVHPESLLSESTEAPFWYWVLAACVLTLMAAVTVVCELAEGFEALR